MIRLAILIVCLGSAFGALRLSTDIPSMLQVRSVQNLTQFLVQNPKIQKLQLLNRDGVNTKEERVFRLGDRVKGDRLVDNDQGNEKWDTPRDIFVIFEYPERDTEVGAIISYVEVVVNQTSNVGNTYVVAGGIGQRRIIFFIEAWGTHLFQYNASVFGY